MRQMKDSGVEWIGEIPEKWSCHRLKYFADVLSGYPFESVLFSNSKGTPLIRIRDITSGMAETFYDGEYDEEYLVEDNELLIGMDGDFNVRWWLGGTALLNQRCCKVTVDNTLLLRYVYYALPFHLILVNELAYATTVKHLAVSDITNSFLPIPSFPEQNAIVSYLDVKCSHIDNIIEKTKASIEEYKKLKQAIITQAVTKGVRGERLMKDSGIEWICEIPEEWNDINPKALFVQRKDKARQGERQLTSSQLYGIIYQDEYMEMTGSKVVTVEKDFDILKHVEVGDFVISMRSFQGGLEYSTRTGSISSAYVMLIPNDEKVFSRYYRWLLKSSIYINALQSTSNMVRDGQAMRYSNFAQIRLLEVPLEEQKEIADYLDEKCEKIDILLDQKTRFIAELESYKKSMIYEYVTGKKEVKYGS